MKQKWVHKIFTTVLTAVILLPFFIQAAHAFEKHEHQICTIKNVKHFHIKDIDCSVFHFQIKHNSVDFSSEFSIQNFEQIIQEIQTKSQSDYIFNLTSKSSRAPPYFII